VSLPDVVSAYHTTGIPEISGYYEATPAMRSVVNSWRYFGALLATTPILAAIDAWSDILWRGPTTEERRGSPTVIVAEAEDARGCRVVSRLRTPEPYSLTAAAAAAVAARVLSGDFETGFETPARLFGADFILSFEGVVRDEVV
jgi:short subunit dehydrogenase-like uncharacterized protein